MEKIVNLLPKLLYFHLIGSIFLEIKLREHEQQVAIQQLPVAIFFKSHHAPTFMSKTKTQGKIIQRMQLSSTLLLFCLHLLHPS